MALIRGRLATGLMRVVGPVQRRPSVPNTTHAPLGLAPDDRVDVYVKGTILHALTYQDARGQQPRANSAKPRQDALYAVYVVPEPIDLQVAGRTRYTLPDVLVLDPDVLELENDFATLQENLPGAFDAFLDSLRAIRGIGSSVPMGGSLSQGLQSAVPAPAVNAITFQLTGSNLLLYTATLTVGLRTENALTSVAASLYDVTDPDVPVLVGSTAPSVSLTAELLTVDVALGAGTRDYQLWLTPGNADAFVYGNGYLLLSQT